MEELTQAMETIARKYPDKTGVFLRKQGLKARGRTIREVRNSVDTDESSNYSLGKVKNYSVSQPKGYGAGQYVELSAKSPHFHLIEHGHNLLDRRTGQPVGKGWVQGYQVMDAAARESKTAMPYDAEQFIDQFMTEEGF
jgi:hypothetical protein